MPQCANIFSEGTETLILSHSLKFDACLIKQDMEMTAVYFVL